MIPRAAETVKDEIQGQVRRVPRRSRRSEQDLAFAGRGTGPGQLGTGHGLTVPRGTKRIDVADGTRSNVLLTP